MIGTRIKTQNRMRFSPGRFGHREALFIFNIADNRCKTPTLSKGPSTHSTGLWPCGHKPFSSFCAAYVWVRFIPNLSKIQRIHFVFAFGWLFRGVQIARLCSGAVQGLSEQENRLSAAPVGPHRGGCKGNLYSNSPLRAKTAYACDPKARRIRLCCV